ncbi:MAG: Endoribonuclease [Myxococcaceae bacterium]|jgi:2-iminobutanoate/2-iminopropanoate deaminase|nr:Endoribonuclease [Myxococcaceae bacterium]
MKVIQSDNAPAAIGPYSQAIEANGFVFVSGQIAIDPKSGSIVEGGIAAETAQVLANLEAVLAAAGCTLADVVKTTIYLKSLADFQVVNALYGKKFTGSPPARATVEVSALPRGAVVEIDAVAVKK